MKTFSDVIPAKAGIQSFHLLLDTGSMPAPDSIQGPA
jgi:hypothetical protein